MISLSGELKNLGPWKKGEKFLVFAQQYSRLFYIQLGTCSPVKSNYFLTTDIFLITGIYDDDPEIITLSYSDFGGCVNNT